jgi:hypothetical protein
MTSFYISYGITKSASTFAWQLIKTVAIKGGIPIATLTSKSKGRNSPEDYLDPISEESLRLVRDDVGDAPVVLKTHGGVTPTVVTLVQKNEALVFASYRDLREIALSLLDHAAKSRMRGISDFADLSTVNDTLPLIKDQVQRFENWVSSTAPLLIPYNEIAFDTNTTINRIAERLSVPVDAETIAATFDNKTSIGQFNRGEKRRFEREMLPETSALFLRSFSGFYGRYFPEEDAGTATPAEAVAP